MRHAGRRSDRASGVERSDLALLRPLLSTLVLALYSRLLFWAGEHNGVTAFVPGWEGKVPYFSPWETVLPWLCMTSAFAVYLAGVCAVRLSRRAFVGLVVVVLTGGCAVAALTQAVELRDRDNAEHYNTCRRVDKSRYRCEGGTIRGIPPGLSQSEKQALLYSGPPPYPHPRERIAAIGLGFTIFAGAPLREKRRGDHPNG